jgi:lysylphosphatidylglycerol synthetase-like protein (DUF2156 family)
MKKLVYIIPLVAFSFLAIMPAFAQITAQQPAPQEKDLSGWLGVLSGIARWIYTIILVISVFMALYAAILYLTAGGDQNKVKKASSTLIFAIVGIVVAILAFSISRIAIGLVG